MITYLFRLYGDVQAKQQWMKKIKRQNMKKRQCIKCCSRLNLSDYLIKNVTADTVK